jgi:hypothetical protein
MKRQSTLIPGVLSLAVLLSAPAAVRAQPVATASPAPDGADAKFRDGNALYKQQKYAEAKAAFEQAFRQKPAHDIAANLGHAELKLGQLRDAAEHLAFAVRIWPPTGKEGKKQYALDGLALAKKEIATLTIRVSAPGAEVFVDERSVGRAPLDREVFVDAGAHTIEAKLAGWDDAKQTITATKGSEQEVSLTLAATKPLPLASAVPPPSISAAPLPVGPSQMKKPPSDPSTPIPALLIASGVLAVAGVGAGIGLTVAANGQATDAASLRAKLGGQLTVCTGAATVDCKALTSTLGKESTLSNAAIASFAVGGAFVLTTVGLGVWRLKTPAAQTAIRVVPVVGNRNGGLLLVGEW